MSYTENINRYIVPNDLINNLMQVYKYIGKNELYSEIAKSNLTKIVEQTIQRDTFFLAKLIGLEISDTRLRLIITKNSLPRNREESILFNLLEILNDIQLNTNKYDLSLSKQINTINYIYQNQNIKFIQKEMPFLNNRTKREFLEDITNKLNIEKDNIENIILYMNYFIDLYNLNPLTAQNNTLSFLTLYITMLKSDLDCFRYISLFEIISNNQQEFNDRLMDVSYNWEEGLGQPTVLLRYFTNLLVEAYKRVEQVINDYKVDQNISKGDNIENTVNELSTIFTKDQIRLIHPYVSESTINRALQKLRDEKKIKPLGKGRSAKWIKISII